MGRRKFFAPFVITTRKMTVWLHELAFVERESERNAGRVFRLCYSGNLETEKVSLCISFCGQLDLAITRRNMT